MNYLDLLQKYLANLGVMVVKLHNLHWNVTGDRFMRIHTFTEELYNQAFEDFDEVAELLKTKEILPLSTLKEYLNEASIEEITARDFSSRESLEILKKDLEIMRQLGTDIRNQADEAGDFEVVALFEDYVAFFSKNIWFTQAMLG